MIEGKEGIEMKTLHSIQIAATVTSGVTVLKVLEFMFSQLPPNFGKEVELKPAP